MNKSDPVFIEAFKTIAFLFVCFSFLSSFFPFMDGLRNGGAIEKIPNNYQALIICLVFTIIFENLYSKEHEHLENTKIGWRIQIITGVILFPMVLVFSNDFFKTLTSVVALFYSVVNAGIKGYALFQFLGKTNQNRRKK